MCFWNDEPAEFYESEIRRARKPRHCDGCRGEIARGDLYRAGRGKFEGSWYTFDVCGMCDRDRERIHEAELDEGCSWNESWCPIEEVVASLPDYDLDRSSKEAGQDWLRSRRIERQHAQG
jgi:hypothetical protein